MRILVINPNTSAPATERIGRTAQRVAAAGTEVTAVSAQSGIPLIQTEEQSARAAAAVVELIRAEEAAFDAIVIAAFTDPGLEQASDVTAKPVVGIAQSAMLDAAAGGRRFVIITLGQGLAGPLRALAARYGVADRLANIRILPAPFTDVAYDPEHYAEQFLEQCRAAVAEDGAGAVVIGAARLPAWRSSWPAAPSPRCSTASSARCGGRKP